MTVKDILQRHFYSPDYEDKIAIMKAMKEFARIMCKKQREICAENATTETDTSTSFIYTSVNTKSIINSPLPEELQ